MSAEVKLLLRAQKLKLLLRAQKLKLLLRAQRVKLLLKARKSKLFRSLKTFQTALVVQQRILQGKHQNQI
ncbi:hypothetical protein LDG_5232 [Legionella drancourtii LLAP12]|uniref:Uncharacterized protein n=1 Tax=Legionella drancourtii LLAP12 TaxID=658187 RepID=G9EJ74_9GAMM|nr:hypothetical protein LDG_5232 [Legionella drancourtii LLAP12]